MKGHPADLDQSGLYRLYQRFTSSKSSHTLSLQQICQEIAQILSLPLPQVLAKLTKNIARQSISWSQFLNVLDTQSDIREKRAQLLLKKNEPLQLKELRTIQIQFLKGSTSYGKKYLVKSLWTLQLKDEDIGFILFDDVNQLSAYAIDLKSKKKLLELKFQQIPSKSQFFKSYRQQPKMSKMTGKSRIGRHSFVQPSRPSRQAKKIGEPKPETSFSGFVNDRQSFKQLNSEQSEDQYIKRQRKRIHSAFQVFRKLPLQETLHFGSKVSKMIQSRNLHQLRFEDYPQRQVRKREISQEKQNSSDNQIRHAQNCLAAMRQENVNLTQQFQFLIKNCKPPQRQKYSVTKCFQMRRNQKKEERKQKGQSVCLTQLTALPQLSMFALANVKNSVRVYKFERDFTRFKFDLQCQVKCQHPIVSISLNVNMITKNVNLLILSAIGQQADSSQLKVYQLSFNSSLKVYELGRQPIYQKQINFSGIGIYLSQLGFCVFSYYGNLSLYNQHSTTLQSQYSQVFCKKYWNKELSKALAFSCLTFQAKSKNIIAGTLDGGIALISSISSAILKSKRLCKSAVRCIAAVDERGLLIVGVRQNKLSKKGQIVSRESFVILLDSGQLQVLQSVRLVNEFDDSFQIVNGFLIRDKRVFVFGYEVRQFLLDEQRIKKLQRKKLLLNLEQGAVSSSFQFVRCISSKLHLMFEDSEGHVAVYAKASLNSMGSFYLPANWNIISWTLSEDGCVLAASLGSGQIVIKNIHSDQICQKIPNVKLQNLQFLPKESEFHLIGSTASGSIMLITSKLKSTKSNGNKMLRFHKVGVTALVQQGQFICSGDQLGVIYMFHLPLFTCKFTVQLHSKTQKSKKAVFQIKINLKENKVCVVLECGTVYWLSLYDGSIQTQRFYTLPEQNHSPFLITDTAYFFMDKKQRLNVQFHKQKGKKSKKIYQLKSESSNCLRMQNTSQMQVSIFMQKQGSFLFDLEEERMSGFVRYSSMKSHYFSKYETANYEQVL